jgi:signal peptidase I
MLANQETLKLIQDVLRKKGYIDIPSYGHSMEPYIKKGDLCRFVPFNPSSIKKGDVVLYIAASGQLIGHRIKEITHTYKGIHYRLKGDTNLGFDEELGVEQFIGKLLLIQRGEKILEPSDLPLKLWTWAVLTIPMVSIFLNIRVTKKRAARGVHLNVL